MAKETNRVLGHADEADGIEEYDNPLPDWWLGMFWLCILFAIVYTAHYHGFGNRSQAGEFEAEMAAADARWPAEAAGSVAFAMTDAAVAAGEEIYMTNCIACHGANLEGGIGQSFQDDEWVHGGTAEDVIRIITEGVPAMGMVSWGNILGAERINQVAAYILARNAEFTGKTWDEIPMSPADLEPVGGEAEAGADPGAAEAGGTGTTGSD